MTYTKKYLLVFFAILLSACSAEYESKNAVRKILKDPDSAKFGEFTRVEEDGACLTVNSRNSYGGYVGDKQAFLSKTSGEWVALTIHDVSHELCVEITKRNSDARKATRSSNSDISSQTATVIEMRNDLADMSFASSKKEVVASGFTCKEDIRSQKKITVCESTQGGIIVFGKQVLKRNVVFGDQSKIETLSVTLIPAHSTIEQINDLDAALAILYTREEWRNSSIRGAENEAWRRADGKLLARSIYGAMENNEVVISVFSKEREDEIFPKPKSMANAISAVERHDPHPKYLKYVGQHPQDLLRDSDTNQPIVNLLGQQKFSQFQHDIGVAPPTSLIKGRYFVAQGCPPRDCGGNLTVYVIDTYSDKSWALKIYGKKAELYGTISEADERNGIVSMFNNVVSEYPDFKHLRVMTANGELTLARTKIKS